MNKIHDMGIHNGERWIVFHCPGCKQGHSIPVTGSRAWEWNGSFDKPTITPSIFVNRGSSNPTAPECHSHVIDGNIQFCNDCNHALVGKTVELPDWSGENND